MFFKATRVKKGGKERIYGQIVQSVRRESDKKPGHVVVASLGQVTEQQAENFKRVFRANRQGEAVVLASDAAEELMPPVAHYKYLDVAVLWKLWQRFGLDQILDGLAVDSQRQMPFADVVAALVFHRCLEPATKIEASRWYPTTALAELQGHRPGGLNNTRIHRALDRLADSENELQAQVARKVVEMRGDYRAVFIDVTDTWFSGEGCDLAQRRKTKEGLWRFKIGIAMICTDEGFPLRWKVLAGREPEGPAVLEAGEWFKSCGLPVEQPLIVDRIMGQIKSLDEMKACGIRYVTALRSRAMDHFIKDTSFFDWTKTIDVAAPNAVAEAQRAAEQVGMTPVRRELWALDLGVVDPTTPKKLKPSVIIDRAQKALALSRAIEHVFESGEATRVKDAANLLGISQPTLSKHRPFIELAPQIQRRIDEGTHHVSVKELQAIARLPHHEQLARFEQAMEQAPGKKPLKAPDATSRTVVYFHPKGFVHYRRKIARYLHELDEEITALNARLASPKGQRRTSSIENHVKRKLLAPKGWETYFDIDIEIFEGEHENSYPQVVLRKNDAWERACQRDGFFVLVAHPDIDTDAERLSTLYSDKHIIEQDFRVIKSVLKLRPVYHHTDPKVRAHVSICMLALLLDRILEHALENEASAQIILNRLDRVCLNAVEMPGAPRGVYTMTRPSPDQLILLDRLDLRELVDTQSLPRRLTPR